MELTKSEMQIMDVFWNEGRALSRADLLECSEDKSWKDSSVHILLNGLLSKGILREAGMVKCSKTYGRTFLPTMSREVYYVTAAFAHRYPPDFLLVMKALLNRPEADKATLQQIQKLLNERMK